jgi:hypothetical protein
MHMSRSILSMVLMAGMTTVALAQQQSAPAAAAASPVQQAPAATAAGSGNGAPSFAELDPQGKGSLQRKDIPKDAEALKTLRAHFSEADTNHDGKVDKGEYDAYVNKSSTAQQPQR